MYHSSWSRHRCRLGWRHRYGCRVARTMQKGERSVGRGVVGTIAVGVAEIECVVKRALLEEGCRSGEGTPRRFEPSARRRIRGRTERREANSAIKTAMIAMTTRS